MAACEVLCKAAMAPAALGLEVIAVGLLLLQDIKKEKLAREFGSEGTKGPKVQRSDHKIRVELTRQCYTRLVFRSSCS